MRISLMCQKTTATFTQSNTKTIRRISFVYDTRTSHWRKGQNVSLTTVSRRSYILNAKRGSARTPSIMAQIRLIDESVKKNKSLIFTSKEPSLFS